jgi:RNA polymerase sigma-70 factor (ECF subfamily)
MSEASLDRRLVQAARRGDDAAFAALVDRHYATVLSSCRRMIGDGELARDAAQEAVVRALLGLDRLRDDSRFGAWLIGIGLNVCRGLLVARDRQLSLETHGPTRDGTAPEPVDLVIGGELAARVRAAIAALPPGQRHAVALFYLRGLTHAEAAEELGTRPGAIKTRLHKARGSLRASLLDTYKEYIDMPGETPQLIPMRVAELRRTPGAEPGMQRHVVFLEDDRGRRLPIWIGPAEATALAIALEHVPLPRPGVYQFAAALLAGAGGQLREVRVTELSASVFYASAILSDGTTIDARPSDAITLALVTDVPIHVNASVLEQADRTRAAFADLLQEADAAADNAHVIADEVRVRQAAVTAELYARQHRSD